MGNKSIGKWLAVLGLSVVAVTAGGITTRAETTTTPAISITDNKSATIVINNPELSAALRKLLGKSATDNFFADDFVNHENYKATTTTGEGGVETTTAVNYQLDLSRTGVTDILELVQFEFPSTLQGINLAENGITNEHLANISTFLSSNTAGGTVVIGDRTMDIRSDFSSIIKKVNLNGNNIDLSQTTSTNLANEKFIFGIQNIGNIHSSGMVLDGEVKPYYYIRKNIDEHYFTYTFKYELSTDTDKRISIAYDQAVSIMDNLKTLYGNNTDTISLEIQSVPNSDTAYFKDYSFKEEFTNFSIKLKDNFSVERKSLLMLNISANGKLEAGSPVEISGFGDNSGIKLSYDNASTSHITNSKHQNFVNITIDRSGVKRTVPLEFIVVDTVKPFIQLVGNSKAFSSQNKEYNDPGVIAYDPASAEDDFGDDLTQSVVKTTDLDITTLGVYTITYTVTDLAGNTSSVTRTVEIKERVLDRIILRTNTEDLIDGADIILSVQPETGVDMSHYENVKYYWYMNDNTKPFQETVGDSATGASTITIVGDASANQQIIVKMIATQKEDGATIELYSDRLDLVLEASLDDNETLILAAAVAVLAIILTISIIALVKYSKGKKRTHHRSKKMKKGQAAVDGLNNNAEIKVYKDYTGVPPSGNGEGGGNVNSRPPETNNKDGMGKQ
jgi:hypothetical protein